MNLLEKKTKFFVMITGMNCANIGPLVLHFMKLTLSELG